MRRRRAAITAREAWISGPSAYLARAINSQPGMALITPRVQRVIDLLDLCPGRRYLDIGCGTAAFADLVAQKAGVQEPPVTMDLAAGPGPSWTGGESILRLAISVFRAGSPPLFLRSSVRVFFVTFSG